MLIFWNSSKIVRNYILLSLFVLFILKMQWIYVGIVVLFIWTEADDNYTNVTFDECLENALDSYGVKSKDIVSTLQKDKDLNEQVSRDFNNPGNEEYMMGILKKTATDAAQGNEYDLDNEYQQPDFGLTQDLDFIQDVAINEYAYSSYLSAPDLTDFNKNTLLKSYIYAMKADSIEKNNWESADLDNYFITAQLKIEENRKKPQMADK